MLKGESQERLTIKQAEGWAEKFPEVRRTHLPHREEPQPVYPTELFPLELHKCPGLYCTLQDRLREIVWHAPNHPATKWWGRSPPLILWSRRGMLFLLRRDVSCYLHWMPVVSSFVWGPWTLCTPQDNATTYSRLSIWATQCLAQKKHIGKWILGCFYHSSRKWARAGSTPADKMTRGINRLCPDQKPKFKVMLSSPTWA